MAEVAEPSTIPIGVRFPLEGYTPERILRWTRTGTALAVRSDSGNTLFAVKLLPRALASNATVVQRLRADVARLGKLDNSGIAPVLDVVERDGQVAVISELIEGVVLADLLADGERLPEAAALVMAAQLADALNCMHEAGVIHRDICPETILIDSRGQARLIDPGMALPNFKPDLAAGTPDYMAPELWNEREATVQTDVYALTATVFQALTGAPPFHARRVAALRARHLRADVPASDAPPVAREVIAQGLAKDPASRFSSAGALRDGIRAAGARLGADWERRGGQVLAAAALACSALYPSVVMSGMSADLVGIAVPVPPPEAPDAAAIVEEHERTRRPPWMVLFGLVALGVAVGTFALMAHQTSAIRPEPSPPPTAPAATLAITPVPPTSLANGGPVVVPPTSAPTPTPVPTPTDVPTAPPSVPPVVIGPGPTPTPKPTPTPSPIIPISP